LLLGETVTRSLVAACVLLGCRAAPAPYLAVPAECNVARIGRVVLDGASVADVAPLAVLEGTFDDPARTARITAVATEMLHVRGYPRAKITVTRQTGCGIELHVAVERGPRFQIETLAFEAHDAFPADERAVAVEDALGTVNAVGGAYVADRMQRGLAELARRYHDAGWIDAIIGEARATYDDTRGTVTVVVPIHAGARYRIGSVVAHGGAPEVRAAVVDALGLRGGEWYDATAVKHGIDRARRTLDRRIELRVQVSSDRRAIDIDAVLGGSHR
jgi:outer membrane protein assembly factor BamA